MSPSLPPPAPRKPVHARRITCSGYLREDGLWDIEGHLTDNKSYGFDNRWRGRVEPGDPVHEMWLRLTVDDGLVIKAVALATDKGPHEICGAITVNYQRLVGARIGPGWRGTVRKLVGGPEGCTHHSELLFSLATAAYQAVFPWLASRRKRRIGWDGKDAEGNAQKPGLIDSCHVYAAEGDYVRRVWPDWYRGDRGPAESAD